LHHHEFEEKRTYPDVNAASYFRGEMRNKSVEKSNDDNLHRAPRLGQEDFSLSRDVTVLEKRHPQIQTLNPNPQERHPPKSNPEWLQTLLTINKGFSSGDADKNKKVEVRKGRSGRS